MADVDFSKIFGSSATSTQALTDAEYLQGWGFCGSTPPAYQWFDYVHNLTDLRLQYLYGKIKNKIRLGSTAYAAGALVFSDSLSSYELALCTVAGTTGSSEPTWPAVGSTVTDGTVTWEVVSLQWAYSTFLGAQLSTAGGVGLVPAPTAGQQDSVLTGNATWRKILDLLPVFTGATATADGTAGLMIAPVAGQQGDVYVGDGKWHKPTDVIPAYIGATDTNDGVGGTIPGAKAGQENDVFLGKGTWSSLIDLIHPVGSFYWSANGTNPASLFGGTWLQIKDKFVLAAGDTYIAGATGGEATHTLTTAEMPNHNHVIPQAESANDGTGGFKTFENPVGNKTALNTQYTGGGQAHNNMPPYVVAYCWERTA